MADRSMKGFKENFAGAPTVRANGTAQNLQSFDEITIMSEQPATATPWAPRGTPKKGLSGEAALVTVVDGPKQLSYYDDADNKRADNTILTRATPTSQKGEKSAKPKYLRTYTDMEGENIP